MEWSSKILIIFLLNIKSKNQSQTAMIGLKRSTKIAKKMVIQI